jgi:ricin-type beta-trefoil lectin protein
MRSLTTRWGRVTGLAAVAALTVGGTAYAAVQAAAGAEFTSTLVNATSAKCVEVPGGAKRNGLQLKQATCTGVPAQQFRFAQVEGDVYTVKNVATGYCLEVAGSRTTDGAQIVQRRTCRDQASQQFVLTAVSSLAGGYQLIGAGSAKCLDIAAGSTADGAALQQWTCGDAATAGNQIWRLTDVPEAAPAESAGPVPSGPSSAPTATPSAGSSSSATPVPSSSVTRPPASGPGAAGTNADWGTALPPEGAALSRAYDLIFGEKDKGYQPKAGECSWEIHARYWTWGPDGKVYPTWHPARDASGCSFGHEHGDDPRTSSLFASTGWNPFGYTNELLAPSDPNKQRNEDHVGHKIAVGNKINTYLDNNKANSPQMSCDALIKAHQGTHSPDALTNNLHELSYNVKCLFNATGEVTETRFNVLLPIGHPGGFTTNNLCDGSGTTLHNNVGAAVPSNSPDGGYSHRKIADTECAAEIAAGGQITRMDELWSLELHIRNAGGLKRFDLNPYLIVSNPSRYYDPAKPGMIGRNIDLCYQGAKGAPCDTVRALTAKSGQQIPWDSVQSPLNGARRHLDPNRFVVQNTGPTTLYTDVFGTRFSTTTFPGAIEQFISGNQTANAESQGDIFIPFKNFAANAADGIHAPN